MGYWILEGTDIYTGHAGKIATPYIYNDLVKENINKDYNVWLEDKDVDDYGFMDKPEGKGYIYAFMQYLIEKGILHKKDVAIYERVFWSEITMYQ